MSEFTAAPESTEPRPSSPALDVITFSVKANNDTKYTVSFPLSATIAEVKAKLVELSEIPVDRQRLIYSGRVMKNEETLETYKVKDGNTVHMVKGAVSNAAASTSNMGGAVGGSASGVPRNLASGSGNNPLTGLTGARYAGHVQLPSADMFGPDGGMGPPPDPEGIAQAMANPMFQAQMNEMLRNPQLLDYIIASNPVLQSMGPQARQLMQSDLFRQMMTDPSLIRQMSRMGAGAGAGLGGQAPAFPAPGVTDSTPSAEGQQQPPPQQPGTNPFASLFGAQPFPPNAAGFGALLGHPPFGAPPAQGSQPSSTPADQLPMGSNPLLNHPAFQQMLQAMGVGASAPGSQPASGANSPPVNPFANLLGGIPPYDTASPTSPDTRPPEERYADQLRQLNDMGFYNFEQNIEALRRSGGSVQGAINQLLGG